MEYNIIIRKYEPKDFNEWDNFVEKSNNGTIFQLQKFLQYHAPNKFDFTSYMIYNGERLVGVLPGGFKQDEKVYWSPVGASYGGVVTADLPFEISLAIIDKLLQFFKEKGTKEMFLIPPPLIYSTIYNQHLEYAMLYRKFDFEYHYISHAIDLSLNYKHNFDAKTKLKFNKIHKNKALKIVQQNDFAAFYPILVQNKLKHNAAPTHSLEDLMKLDELLPGKLKLFLAYLGDVLIGGNLMFIANNNVALCFYNMMDYNYDKAFPSYALVEHVIDWSKENGFCWFDFGVSQDTTSDNPMTPSLSLIDFKEKFSTRGIFRSTYHKVFTSTS